MCPDSLPSHVPQVLINREPLRHLNFDVELLGDCDVIVNELCHRLGGHFLELCSTTSPANEITTDEVTLPVHSESDDSVPAIPTDSTSPLLATESATDNGDGGSVPMATVSAAVPVSHGSPGPLLATETTTGEVTLPVHSESDGSVPAIPTDSASTLLTTESATDNGDGGNVPVAMVSTEVLISHSSPCPLPATETTTDVVTVPVHPESDGGVAAIPTTSVSTLLSTETAAYDGDDNVPMATVSGTASDSQLGNANVDSISTMSAEPCREESVKKESLNWASLLKCKLKNCKLLYLSSHMAHCILLLSRLLRVLESP